MLQLWLGILTILIPNSGFLQMKIHMHWKSKLCPTEIIRPSNSMAWTRKFTDSLMNNTVIFRTHHCVTITSHWKRALFWQMWWTIFHDAVIFFCLAPCETFQSHMWLMTDFIFLYWVHVLYTKYKLSWIAHNHLFLWGLNVVCPSASASADTLWRTEHAQSGR